MEFLSLMVLLIVLKFSSALTLGFVQIFLTFSGNFFCLFVLVSDFHDSGFQKCVVSPSVSYI